MKKRMFAERIVSSDFLSKGKSYEVLGVYYDNFLILNDRGFEKYYNKSQFDKGFYRGI